MSSKKPDQTPKDPRAVRPEDLPGTADAVDNSVNTLLTDASGKPFLSEDSILEQEARTTLDELNVLYPDISVYELKNIMVHNTQIAFDRLNAERPKGSKLRVPSALKPCQIAMAILEREPIICIQCGAVNADSEHDLLGVYMKDGPDKGIYNTDEKYLRNLIREYNGNISPMDMRDTIQRIRDNAQHLPRTEIPNLVAVNNGIFDTDTKQLMPFDPKYIFLSKSKTNYKANPQLPVIKNPDDNTIWDPESWMKELSDNPEIVELFWQMIGAVIRPFVPWGKSIWMYSNLGNNGKGTLCSLMRNLVGEGSYATITLDAFGQDFQLEPLLNSTCIITDENDVGGYIDRAANLKAVITNDVIQINRKHKVPVSFRFRGIMIQCINDYPKIRDTSDSFYRRQIFIPMTKCFTGRERKYIKQDYLKRPEVLEYILHRVLHMDYDQFIEPEACKLALAEYKEYNNPVEQFLMEILDELKWDIAPFGFLYDIYKIWYNNTVPSGKPQGRNSFIKEVQSAVQGGHFPNWTYLNQILHPGNRMDAPEPLIIQYNLKDWCNPNYDRTDPSNYCRTPLKTSYKGIVRFGTTANNGQAQDDSQTTPDA